ncbi:alpha/beta fold hydrolase [Streptomyces sp. NPDC001185]|uniref:alpha/beta fold hydrolase n=1 Tax=Streptomyces sp. NPDC001185 TaxID=3154380 RepID=UPI0033199C53
MKKIQPVVLVHGFWHGSWSWSLVAEHLAGAGIQSVAVDIEGHGLRASIPASRSARPFDPAAFATEPSPVAHITASSAAADLVERIRMIGGGEPCLVVAHSMGGVIATAAAELAPELISGICYVSAFVPVAGAPVFSYLSYPENEGEKVIRLFAADPAVVGALRIDTLDPARRDEIKETFYNDVDDHAADAAITLLRSDAPAGVITEELTVTEQRYGSVPHSYVVCGQDNTIPVALQRLAIREIDAVSASPTNVIELDSSHSPFLSQPAELAKAIATVLT